MPRPNISEVTTAWAAGLFEGEGSITIRATHQLVCELGMTDEEPVREIGRFWGGSIRVFVPPEANRRTGWRWTAGARDASVFLEAIRPYVRRKRLTDKIALALEFQGQRRQPGPNNPPWDYQELQYGYYLRMKVLNARGAVV